MVPMESVKRGLASYMDSEFMNHVTGIQKWIVGAASAAIIAKAENYAEMLRSNPMLNALNLVDDRYNVDVEALYRYLRPASEKCDATISLPMIGTFTLHTDDIDKLYTFIMHSR